MARKSQKSKGKKGSKQQADNGSWLWVDPARVRFQHARIRPYFSGCGRSVTETLESIRRKELSPSDLPPLQVIVGPEDSSGPWYFSLNNRRLWVLKRCREEGLLENNVIRVRVRTPKSESELERYTIENCALEAKFVREKDPKAKLDVDASKGAAKTEMECNQQYGHTEGIVTKEVDEEEDTKSDSEDECDGGNVNRFSALM